MQFKLLAPPNPPHEIRQILDFAMEMTIDSKCLWCICYQINKDTMTQ